MEVEILLYIGIAILLIGYYIYVLYRTLQKKRKLDKSADARDLYMRTNAFHLFLFGNLFKSNKQSNYKILKEDEPKDSTSLDV